MEYEKAILNHISTHTKHSDYDKAAVSRLETTLLSDGKIKTQFSCDDKWPNHDGTFEYVSNPDISRRPEQTFYVQIKGTHCYEEKDGVVSYSLKSLAFPAFIAKEVTLDPGILFVVLDPDKRGKQRVFWRYLSPSFISKINFNNNSITIKFTSDEEIKDTDDSVDFFCKRLDRVIETHLFCKKLNPDCLNIDDAISIIDNRCEEISEVIDEISENTDLRDKKSKKIVRALHDICYATLILNAYKLGYSNINEKLAWEVAQFNSETKYLSGFLKGLNYIGLRVPDEGQSERLMLKYYSYLWEIRKFLKTNYNIRVLENLEKFPQNLDKLDAEYYENVAKCIEKNEIDSLGFRNSRYYIHNENPFFVNDERYFEITLQLAGVYATKFNRVTVYSKERVSTKYSIQIAYRESYIDLWNVKSKIKIISKWKVSIDPSCMNKLGKILMQSSKISSQYGEYISLMKFLTESGMNLLELIDLQEERFNELYANIFGDENTQVFGKILIKLRRYAHPSDIKGIHIIRYLLLNMREELIEDVLPNAYNNYTISNDLLIRSKCYPFEHNPMLSDLAGHKTNKTDVLEIINDKEYIKIIQPYIKIENAIKNSGEVYFDLNEIASEEDIESYNYECLDNWERDNGFGINEEDGKVCIDSYENDTVFILEKLLKLSSKGNSERENQNSTYLEYCKSNKKEFNDKIKENSLKNAFVRSNLIIIYGAAGTGKTTLVSYLADMMKDLKKLFVTVTHTAKQNIRRKIKSISDDDDFLTLKSIANRNGVLDYDIVFVDECSTIDNRRMRLFLEKLKDDTLLVLSGDIYQIESIDFSNWFNYAQKIIVSNNSNIELLSTWRTNKESLIELWNEVRKCESYNIITEKLAIGGRFSEDLGEGIFCPFEKNSEDEVVLCLNYDGKFGLNNMNMYLQNANPNEQVFKWAEWTFKIGDPIVFIDTKRSALLYNNLKGKIVDIEKNDNRIIFTIDVKTKLSKLECNKEKLEYIENNQYGTRIRLTIIAWNDEMSENEKVNTVIPFQIAYAISIHKAQGLEYDSVKIVIPRSNTEKITHSIFYTAITRAKKNLKIYWSAETMNQVVKSFTNEKFESRSLEIIKNKLSLNDFDIDYFS